MSQSREQTPQPGPSGASPSELLAFERMLAEIAARFAAVGPDFLGFDRSTLVEYFPQAGRLVTVCSVAVRGVDPLPVGPLEPRDAHVRACLAGKPAARGR